jgi:hypothetical protein
MSSTLNAPTAAAEHHRTIAQANGHQAGRKPIPHTAFLRTFQMADGRSITIDKRLVGFICEGKPEKFEGKRVTIIGFRCPAQPVPVTAGYHETLAWWKESVK